VIRLAAALAFIAIEILAIGSAVADGQSTPSPDQVVVADYRKNSDVTAQCVRDNAPRVEAAISDLAQATKFLVEDVCAVPVARENAERMAKQTEAANAQWQKMCDDEKNAKEVSKSKGTGTLSFGCSMMKATQRVGVVNTNAYVQDVVDSDDEYMFVGQGSPTAVALASSLLLDLRLSHSKSGTAH